MKTLDEAMRQYCGDGGRAYLKGDAFIAGARYVLDAMVSDAAIRAASESVARDDEGEFQPLGDLIGFSGENKTRTVLRAALAAVRKEIEG